MWPQRSTRQERSEVDMLPSRIGLAHGYMKSSQTLSLTSWLKCFYMQCVVLFQSHQNKVLCLWFWVSLGVTFCDLELFLSPPLIVMFCDLIIFIFCIIPWREVVVCCAVGNNTLLS